MIRVVESPSYADPLSSDEEFMDDFPFKSIERAALTAYSFSLDRIKWDLVQADTALSGSTTDYADLVHAAAHLRLVIENTVFASLFSNRRLLLDAEHNLKAKRDMGETRKLIRRVTPRYWPQGVCAPGILGGAALEPHPDSLAEDAYTKAWGRLSALLHGRNPYLQCRCEPDEIHAWELDLAKQLHATLDYHFIYLPENEILYARVASDPIAIQMLKVDER